MSIREKADAVVKQFNQYADWEDRYRELIKIGKSSVSPNSEQLIEKYLVKGCQSQVWLIPSYKSGKVYFLADSDAAIVSGIVALLVQVFSGSEPKEILDSDMDFLKQIGITEHLSMNRTNGLASMIKQIKFYAFAYQSLFEKGIMDAP